VSRAGLEPALAPKWDRARDDYKVISALILNHADRRSLGIGNSGGKIIPDQASQYDPTL
jgi:hypothetical protein